MRRSSGRCGDYGDTVRKAPPGCMPSIYGSGCGNIGKERGRKSQKRNLQTQTQKDGIYGPKKGGWVGKEEREQEKTKWERVTELVQTAFRDIVLAEEATWQAVVLIQKGGGKYRCISLMEVMWKAVAVILNHRFTTSIKSHDSLLIPYLL